MDAVAPFEKEAGNLAECPKKWEEVVEARRNLRKELADEREARERGEGALRRGIEKLELAMRTSGNRWEEWGERALSVAELLDEALAALKSSQESK